MQSEILLRHMFSKELIRRATTARVSNPVTHSNTHGIGKGSAGRHGGAIAILPIHSNTPQQALLHIIRYSNIAGARVTATHPKVQHARIWQVHKAKPGHQHWATAVTHLHHRGWRATAPLPPWPAALDLSTGPSTPSATARRTYPALAAMARAAIA